MYLKVYVGEIYPRRCYLDLCELGVDDLNNVSGDHVVSKVTYLCQEASKQLGQATVWVGRSCSLSNWVQTRH
jgi:hypothetical protein